MSSHLSDNYKALGSKRRIAILQYLNARERRLLDIAGYLRVHPATASFHTKKLLREGFIEAERHGKETRYRVAGQLRTSRLYVQILRSG